MVARCDRKCNATFEVTDEIIEIKKRTKEIHVHQFSCPECGEVYVIGKTNPQLRKLEREISKLKSQGNVALANQKIKEFQNGFNQLNGKRKR